MKRRSFLGTSGLLLVAGCTGTNGDDTPESDDDSDPTDSTENSSTGDSATETEPREQEIDVQISQQGWITEGERIEVLAANTDDAIGSVQVTVQWFDDEDKYLGQDTVGVPALEPQASWFTSVEASVPFEAERFEVSATGTQVPNVIPEDVEVIASELHTDELVVRGRIKNLRDVTNDLDVIAAGYNGDWLTYIGSTSVTDIPAETTWRFQAPLSNVAADDHEIDDDVRLYVYE